MIAAVRLLAIALALSLMIGELWRSWGAGRPLYAVIDDQILGVLLIAGAIALRRDTWRTRGLMAAAWGVTAGMLYGSFFGKVFEPARTNAGNWDLGVLTMLIGVAFATAIIGLVLTLAAPMRTAD